MPSRRPSVAHPVADPGQPLHPLEFAVLAVLAEGVRHGYDVIKQVELTYGPVQPADLYRRMRRLRAAGILEEAAAPKPVKDDDRTRRYYRLTSRGWALARVEAARLQTLMTRTRRRTGLLAPAGRDR